MQPHGRIEDEQPWLQSGDGFCKACVVFLEIEA
jgi:hypothetical protein